MFGLYGGDLGLTISFDSMPFLESAFAAEHEQKDENTITIPVPEFEPTPVPVPKIEPPNVETEPVKIPVPEVELENIEVPVPKIKTDDGQGGGCLIATAAFGSEMAPQIQQLREIRDNTILKTNSGMIFMTGFNQFYYSFSPYIADYERENPIFKETVKAIITPMISTLSIMTFADDDSSDLQVLGLGISIIALNLGMYVAAPVVVGFKIHRKIKLKKLN
jgi:hypothetical protein